jgi:hypothetical protein
VRSVGLAPAGGPRLRSLRRFVFRCASRIDRFRRFGDQRVTQLGETSAAKPIAIARDIWPTAAPPSARGTNAAQHGLTGAPDAGLGVPMLDRRSPERDDSVTAVA